MKFNSYKYGLLLLLLIAAAVFLWGLLSCSKDQNSKGKPFVRLLENEVVNSKIFNREILYSVLLPESYNASTDSFPVVYLLHGFGDDQTAWYKDGLIQSFSDSYSSENVPMIFVMPQGFNSYYVNRYNGSLPYMDFFTTELVPAIDSIYRTKKDKTQRAVMGYSMGGYGALILPAMNPDMFSISVPLSMSFRTDEQYIAEPQNVFDSQWGLIFGGFGTSGTSRLTDYYIEHSPFHFFDQNDLSKYSGLRILLDCGDDEESLHITNGELHNLMRDHEIPHEFRVRNGGHSWDYWHRSLREALSFISDGFNGISYPENPEPVSVGNLISSEQYTMENLNKSNLQLGIFKPNDYDSNSNSYPVMFLLHDYEGTTRSENATKIISFLNNSMLSNKIPKSLVVEIPVEESGINTEILNSVISQISTNYRIVADKKGRVLMGNEKGGALVCSLISDFQTTFNGCFLFNAKLPEDVQAISNVYYYIDVTDKSESYKGNFNLFLDLRQKENDHEYRVRQGTESTQSTINGLNESMNYLSRKLKNQAK
jgi:S-formylglutathione hydrolase FrmB